MPAWASGSCSGGGVPQTSRADAGSLTHFTVSGGVSGEIVTEDGVQAAAIADIATPASITFAVKDQVEDYFARSRADIAEGAKGNFPAKGPPPH